MTSFPPLPSLHLSLNTPIQIFPLPATLTLTLPLNLSPSSLLSRPYARTHTAASLSPSSTSFPYSFPHPFRQTPNQQQQQQQQQQEDEDDDRAIGDCLVFDDGAFEDCVYPSPRPAPDYKPDRPRRGRPAAEVTPETLVPEKWKEAAERLNLTKKERRKMAHQLKSRPRVEWRKKISTREVEEYQAYRELKLSQLKPVVLDVPRQFPPDMEAEEAPREMIDPPERGRAAPRNPRLGSGGGTLEDIADLFNSGDYAPGEGDYVPGEVNDDKKPQQGRKLFTQEEKVLLNRRIPDLSAVTSNKWMPIHTLAASGEFYLLDMLMKHNADVNAIDKDGFSAIHRAIIGKKQAIVNYLLRNSGNPFIRDKEGATLIHYAVQTASSQTIKILLLYDVDINLADNDGWTPLHLAVQTQRTDIVRLLLIKGADRTLKNRDGLTALDLCFYSGHGMRTYELIKLLKEMPNPKSHP